MIANIRPFVTALQVLHLCSFCKKLYFSLLFWLNHFYRSIFNLTAPSVICVMLLSPLSECFFFIFVTAFFSSRVLFDSYFYLLLFLCWTCIFSWSVCGCLLEYFCDICFKVLVRKFQPLCYLDISVCWSPFLILAKIYLVLGIMSSLKFFFLGILTPMRVYSPLTSILACCLPF